MQEVQVHHHATGQFHTPVKRWNIEVQNVANLRFAQWQARENQHAIRIGQRSVAGVQIVGLNALELAQPPVIGFDGQHNIGLHLADVAQAARGVPVKHQYVGHHDAQVIIGIASWAAG